ncbi:MAG: sulfotransferase [Woeseiaceae bacterium]|nr:sulfotransferase [Woeseiaceae bacterium]
MTANNEEKYGVESIDFLCIGAQKSGTTFVASSFRSHPEIQLPTSKELHFFSPKGEYKTEGGFAQCNADKDIEWYGQQFVPDDRKKGEISTHYLFDPASAGKIKEAYPDIKIFSILRNPVDRAFSQYNMERYKTGKERRSLIKIIQEEPDNEIMARGLYARQLAPYMRQFSDDQLRVYLFDDMKRDPAAFFLDLFSFIGVDTSVVPPSLNKRMNKSRKTKFVFIPRFVRFIRTTLEAAGLRNIIRTLNRWGVAQQLRKFNNRYNQVATDFEMSPVERAALHEYFVDDIEQLEKLINRDLSHWKNPR